ncbi:uncharacterized protein LOC128861051 [Anastrepha ludens]|uniref:uncharacterized protein LOC128861051 n=1 Tax=Anastrepha ludens TaxID=28586 RepID=UPI0023B1B67D|nr:uncharacterized protein LOC128861051 [Anastrepha ludens]
MKIQFLIFTFSVLFALCNAASECRTPLDIQICVQLNRRCRETAPKRTPALPTDSLGVFNQDCRRRVEGRRNVALCDMLWAVCELTIIKCEKISCSTVAGAVKRLNLN